MRNFLDCSYKTSTKGTKARKVIPHKWSNLVAQILHEKGKLCLTSNFPIQSLCLAEKKKVKIMFTTCTAKYKTKTLPPKTQTYRGRTTNSVVHRKKKKKKSYPELIRSELIDVGSWTRDGFVPETELQQQLVPTRQQHLPPLIPVLHKLLQQRQMKEAQRSENLTQLK